MGRKHRRRQLLTLFGTEEQPAGHICPDGQWQKAARATAALATGVGSDLQNCHRYALAGNPESSAGLLINGCKTWISNALIPDFSRCARPTNATAAR